MTLKQLIGHYSWLNVEAALLQAYPGEGKRLFAYEAVYYQLLLLPVVETDLQIELKRIVFTGAGSNSQVPYIDICGEKQTPHVADAEICLGYTLDFTPWAEWISMPISSKTFQSFSETAIVAHCLWGMTFYAFDETVLRAKAAALARQMDKIECMTDEERQVYLMQWKQLKEQPVRKAE